MKSTILLCFFLLVTATAKAELWVCYDKATVGDVIYNKPSRYSGDCKALNLCTGLNNTGIKANCFEATQTEYDNAGVSLMQVNTAAGVGSRVFLLSKEDKDKIAVYNGQVVAAAEKAQAENMEISTKDLMTSFINLYNSKMPIQYRVTTDELKTQIKSDLGISE